MNENSQHKVVIIGAGLTGLTIGFYLKKAGVAFKILEKSHQTGGVIQSHNVDGFLFESGPNTGVLGNPETAELFEDLKDSCKLETANPDAKRRLIWKSGKWHALPSGPLSAIRTPLFRFRDKLRVLGEPFRKKGTDPLETVASMVTRRLGKSFLDYAINPFISGIYAGNPELLVTKYALPKMYNLEYEYGSLIKGGIKKAKLNKQNPRMAKATREVFSAQGGLNNLIQALSDSIGKDNIVLNAESVDVKPNKSGYSISYLNQSREINITCDKVITTTGAHTLPGILSFLDKKLDPITALNYAKVALVVVGYKEWIGIPLNAFGGLIPAKEGKNMLGVLFTSSFLDNRAPENGALLSCFIGGSRFPKVVEYSDDELTELVLANMKEMMHTNQQPDLLKIFRYEHAIPQYEANTKERLEAIVAIEQEFEGLIIAGNVRNGIGMADRIKQGRTIAEKLIEVETTAKS